MKVLIVMCAAALIAGSAVAAPPSPTACVFFETEVVSVGPDGTMHSLFNFGQSLPTGVPWQTKTSQDGLTLSVAISWRKAPATPIPAIDLSLVVISPEAPGDGPAPLSGTARLEPMLWLALLGPEPFTSSDGSAFLIPGRGRPLAVTAASPTPCL